jgi:hypothetical protein
VKIGIAVLLGLLQADAALAQDLTVAIRPTTSTVIRGGLLLVPVTVTNRTNLPIEGCGRLSPLSGHLAVRITSTDGTTTAFVGPGWNAGDNDAARLAYPIGRTQTLVLIGVDATGRPAFPDAGRVRLTFLIEAPEQCFAENRSFEIEVDVVQPDRPADVEFGRLMEATPAIGYFLQAGYFPVESAAQHRSAALAELKEFLRRYPRTSYRNVIAARLLQVDLGL